MSDINNGTISGHIASYVSTERDENNRRVLTSDPSDAIVYFESGSCLMKVRVAVTTIEKDGKGWKEIPLYLEFSVWGSDAEYLANYSVKGQQITISYRLKPNNWTNAEGRNQTAIEFVAERIILGRTPKPKEEKEEKEVPTSRVQEPKGWKSKSKASSKTAKVPVSNNGHTDIADDDIPY